MLLFLCVIAIIRAHTWVRPYTFITAALTASFIASIIEFGLAFPFPAISTPSAQKLFVQSVGGGRSMLIQKIRIWILKLFYKGFWDYWPAAVAAVKSVQTETNLTQEQKRDKAIQLLKVVIAVKGGGMSNFLVNLLVELVVAELKVHNKL